MIPVFDDRDLVWRDLAYASREALARLGYDISARCLPDEADPCTGTFALHVIAHLAAIKAVADHHLEHLQPPAGMVDEISRNIAGDIACEKTCHRTGL